MRLGMREQKMISSGTMEYKIREKITYRNTSTSQSLLPYTGKVLLLVAIPSDFPPVLNQLPQMDQERWLFPRDLARKSGERGGREEGSESVCSAFRVGSKDRKVSQYRTCGWER